MNELRRIELQENGTTRVVRMADLKLGDIFKAYESDTNEQVGTAWKVVSMPTIDKNGVSGVIVDPV